MLGNITRNKHGYIVENITGNREGYIRKYNSLKGFTKFPWNCQFPSVNAAAL